MDQRLSRTITRALAGVTVLGVLGLATGVPVTAASPDRAGTIVYALPPQVNLTWYLPLVNASNNTVYNFQLLDQEYVPLLYIGSDYAIDMKDSAAARVTYNHAGTVYHVFLKPGLRWSNGTPVTSADVLFTWHVIEAASQADAPAPWPYVGAGSGDIPDGVKSVVADGTDEVTVTLKQPTNQAWFLYNGLSQLTPLPAAALDRYPHDITAEIRWLGQEATSPAVDRVVDGPYRLTAAVSNQSWTLTRNPSYTGGPAAFAKRIVFAYESSDTAEFSALKTGQVQVGYLPNSLYGARAELTDHLINTYSFSFQGIRPNLSPQAPDGAGKILNQLYIRQAMEMAIDQHTISSVIYNGLAVPQYGPIPPEPSTVYFDQTLAKPLYPYDPAKAKALLEQHGWHMVDGVMTKGTQKLSFTMLMVSGSTASTEETELIQQEWAQIGIKVTLRPEPFATIVGLDHKANDWQLAAGTGIIYGGSYPSGEAIFGTGGGANNVDFNNAHENALIAATHTPWPNSQVNFQHFFAYEEYTAAELPNIWTPHVASILAVAPNVHVTVANDNPSTGDPLMQYWWVSPK